MGRLAQIRRLFDVPALLPLAILLLVALVLAGGQAFAVEAFPDDCKLVRQAALPFTTEHGHITVAVTVNGQLLHFIVDTGGFYSAISPEAVTRLGLQTHAIRDDLKISDAGGAKATQYARIQDLVIGTTRAQGLTLMAADLAPGEDGVLAPEMLRNFDLEFDFGGRILNLFKPHPCEDHVVYWTDDFAAVPFDITAEGHIRLPVSVNGVAMRAILDTGAPASMIAADAAAPLHSEAAPGSAIAFVGGNGGMLQGAPQNFDSLVIGKFLWQQPLLMVSPSAGGWKSDGAQLLLGLSALRGLHFTIDYRRKTLYLSRS